MMPASNMKSVVHHVPHEVVTVGSRIATTEKVTCSSSMSSQNTGMGGCHTPTADACNTKASFAVDLPFRSFLSCELLLPLPQLLLLPLSCERAAARSPSNTSSIKLPCLSASLSAAERHLCTCARPRKDEKSLARIQMASIGHASQ